MAALSRSRKFSKYWIHLRIFIDRNGQTWSKLLFSKNRADSANVAKQPKILHDQAAKKRGLKLRDLASRRGPKGGSSKSRHPAEGSKAPIPKSLEEFLRSDSLRID
jgi:hypothetical protein